MSIGRSPALAVSGLSCHIGGRAVLDGVTLSVARGRITGLLGPNGAGKSSLLRVLAGRLTPDAGTLAIDGVSPDEARRSARLGIVPQDIALYPHLTVRENLSVLGRLAGVPADTLDTRVAEGIAWAGLDDRADALVPTLSGGMRRRVNLVAGTLHRPALLLLDEPTVGVDRDAQQRLHELLRALRAQNLAIVLATHDLAEADTLCDDVVILRAGRVADAGTVADVVARVLGGHRTWWLRVATPVPAPALARLTALGFAVRDDDTWTASAPADGSLDAVAGDLAAAGAVVREWRAVAPGLAAAVEALTGRVPETASA